MGCVYSVADNLNQERHILFKSGMAEDLTIFKVARRRRTFYMQNLRRLSSDIVPVFTYIVSLPITGCNI